MNGKYYFDNSVTRGNRMSPLRVNNARIRPSIGWSTLTVLPLNPIAEKAARAVSDNSPLMPVNSITMSVQQLGAPRTVICEAAIGNKLVGKYQIENYLPVGRKLKNKLRKLKKNKRKRHHR